MKLPLFHSGYLRDTNQEDLAAWHSCALGRHTMKTLVLLALAAIPLSAAGMRAGVARVDITPRGPIWMSGYASRNHPSEGVRQPLWARALAIESAGGRVVIVAIDLVALPAEVSDQVAV